MLGIQGMLVPSKLTCGPLVVTLGYMPTEFSEPMHPDFTQQVIEVKGTLKNWGFFAKKNPI